MKKYKTPIIVGVIIIVALVAAFFVGGDNSTVNRKMAIRIRKVFCRTKKIGVMIRAHLKMKTNPII